MTVKELTYMKRGEDIYYPPLTYYIMEDDTAVGIYQGFRGENPDLDFIVKYREPGKRLRTPSHTHWIVDLLVKCEYSKVLVGEYITMMLRQYNLLCPFQNIEERNNYQIMIDFTDYKELNGYGHYNISTLSAFIELFIRCEKQSSEAFMFKTLLQLVLDYCDGKKDFYQVVGYSKRV
jgi:hypothetical protein